MTQRSNSRLKTWDIETIEPFVTVIAEGFAKQEEKSNADRGSNIPLMFAQYRVASAAGVAEFVARVQPGEQGLQSPGLHPGYGLKIAQRLPEEGREIGQIFFFVALNSGRGSIAGSQMR